MYLNSLPRRLVLGYLWRILLVFFLLARLSNGDGFRCGAASVDISPRHLPVIRNGGFLQAEDDKVLDPLHARCVVIDGGEQRIAIVVVDSCMLPLQVCDEAKVLASQATGIGHDKILIAATHTHSAPSVMEYCLGSGSDARYRAFLPGKIAEGIQLANQRLVPARAGWARMDGSGFTKCRRWITRSDQWLLDPFGERTVHANMHPGHQNPNYVGPSGPVDPWLSILMLTDKNGGPIAALANFSMHYFSGHSGISADYYGRFAKVLEDKLGANHPGFVAIMSQGTSGDLWWGDYSRTKEQKPFQHMYDFADGLADLAVQAIQDIEYQAEVPVRMAERRLTLRRRVPDEKRLAWARRLNRLRGDRLPQNRPEVYALQAVHLSENPTDEVVLQAIRIGALGITGMPNEVYGLTGLKLKQCSPLDLTFNMSLANGACGYIPPPEQHALGGYNTWPATTAGLEVSAEPRIVQTLLGLLEQIAEKPRKMYQEPKTKYSQWISDSQPYAYWRLAEMQQGPAADSSGNGRSLRSHGLVAYHLPGKTGPGFADLHNSHAVQLAGGKLVAEEIDLGESYSIQTWISLGAPFDYRGTTAVLFSRANDRLLVTGRDQASPGHLQFGNEVGKTRLRPNHWHHLTFVRNGDFVQVYLDDERHPEITLKTSRVGPELTLWLGGDADDTANLEGKLDEISIYDRALTPSEISAMYQVARGQAPEHKKESDSPQLDSAPLEPTDSLHSIQVPDGFQVELIASEPLVQDPVAIDWDTEGRLWVAEMADYPLGIDGKGKPGGRIRVLTDTDQDGNYDASTLFLQDIGFPNGVMTWRNGVLVTAAPELFYAEDTDGDGRADVKEVLFSGFMEGNQQLRVNGLRWGLDNLVHCASGAHHAGFGSGNSIRSTKTGDVIVIGSRDFRFHPDSGWLDPQSGPSQYGRVRNDFGDWFGVQNSWPLWHYVLQDHYTRRNGRVPSVDPRQQVRMPRMPEVYSAKPPQRRFHGFDHAGHYTSACGICIYRDEVLFPRSEAHAFTCEPFHNLVQHHILRHASVSYSGRRADDGPVDFFASTDRWTRPVMSRTGPDGALWIVDMYRYMIEHPQWLPESGQEALRSGYRAGEGMGRIYRIVRQGAATRAQPFPMADNWQQRVELLRHPNGIVRDLAHRRLLQDPKPEVADATDEIARDRMALPEARIQALSLLTGLQARAPQTLRQALQDASPSVRRFAIRMAEGLHEPQMLDAVLALVNDEHPQVQLQLACSLGEWSDPEAGVALAKLATRGELDVFTRAAIVSSLPQHYRTFIDSILPDWDRIPAGIVDAMLLVGEDYPEELCRIVQRLCDTSLSALQPSRRTASSGGRQIGRIGEWLDSLHARNLSLEDLANEEPKLLPAVESVRVATNTLRTQLRASNRYQQETVALLGREPTYLDEDLKLLTGALSNQQTTELQQTALHRLEGIQDQRVADLLVRKCAELLPNARAKVVQILLRRWQWQLKLLEGIKAGAISRQEVSLAQRQRLLASRNNAVAALAQEVVGTSAKPQRLDIVSDYRRSVYSGNASRGRDVFQANCEVCHTLDRHKRLIGPDLRSLTRRSKDALLEAILDPSQNIDPKFTAYTFLLASGQSVIGLVTHEDQQSLTLLNAEGQQRRLLRSAIESSYRSIHSIMPEGFELKIDPRQMSDLIAFIQAL